MENTQKLATAFRIGLGLPAAADVSTLAYRQVAEWDSVAHMQLIMEIETAFDIMLPTEDVIALSSFDAAMAIVAKYGFDFT
jgi:acyl carrier protein